jgi:hypothetical protein
MSVPQIPESNEETKKINYLKNSGYEVDYLVGNLGSSLIYLALFS